jgi:Restriction alleviation protein Lar
MTDAANLDTSLLPCPFCGGEAALRENPYGGDSGFLVECRHGAGAIECGCVVHPCTMPMTTPEAAAKVWNTRPPAPLYPVIRPWTDED